MIRMILLKNHFPNDGMKAHCTIMLQSKEEMITEAYEKVAVVAALNSSCSYP
jgi:methylmalonyl-CoA mutase cobalamin-binding subunit